MFHSKISKNGNVFNPYGSFLGRQLNAASRKNLEIQVVLYRQTKTLSNRKFVKWRCLALISHESRNSEESIIWFFFLNFGDAMWKLRIRSRLACVYRVMDARRKFGEHESA